MEVTLKRRPPLATIAGLVVIVVSVTLAIVAYSLYPWAFSPAANWISDLGDTFLSPRGSIYFRLDMVALGAVLAKRGEKIDKVVLIDLSDEVIHGEK